LKVVRKQLLNARRKAVQAKPSIGQYPEQEADECYSLKSLQKTEDERAVMMANQDNLLLRDISGFQRAYNIATASAFESSVEERGVEYILCKAVGEAEDAQERSQVAEVSAESEKHRSEHIVDRNCSADKPQGLGMQQEYLFLDGIAAFSKVICYFMRRLATLLSPRNAVPVLLKKTFGRFQTRLSQAQETACPGCSLTRHITSTGTIIALSSVKSHDGLLVPRTRHSSLSLLLLPARQAAERDGDLWLGSLAIGDLGHESIQIFFWIVDFNPVQIKKHERRRKSGARVPIDEWSILA
jgi:hypothetical protein